MLDWTRIETVLLDMDGTLLDLRFDSEFWLNHLPARFADHHGLDDETAQTRLQVLFDQSRRSLQFYCLDWWSERTGLDIVGLKQDLIHLIQYRPSAREFLAAVRGSGRHTVIVTNAHRAGLDLKHRHTGIIDLVDAVESAHDHRLPKEDAGFWSTVQGRLGFDPATTLLVDDNMDALAAAERYGIGHLLAVAQPDSGAARLEGLPYPALEDFALLQPIAPLLNRLRGRPE
ncbi:MAG: GMP/IMP nucleotidase [Gammaproteobacteria bacterium]|nr:GMP/IMP nucleotidase [Gammaproteobacteria bacterium]